ncbi:hypothetical protein D9611_001669 [Ephemerocybe angulata]|uniref:Uncharacterized protein n=1 Tax=Ephemerocybe angulata TaxID=980116 RepID=A0A8H5CK21_9AGAR|nr:hypothetical protein D9611_001669 [Tulosesus angulatus]
MALNLAQRLNELAQANADGLLSDDEYRLLRQSAFEQFSGNVAVPVESPIVPTVTPDRHGSPRSPSRARERPKDNNLTKLSVTNLIRRATGRNSPVISRGPSLPTSPSTPTTSPSSPKRGLIPRLFQRKHGLPPLRISPTQSQPNMRSPTPAQSVTSARSPATPLSPSRPLRPAPRTSQSSAPLHTPSKPSIDDLTLISSADIRDAIVSLDNELRGLVDAFNALEQGAVRRIKKQNARRLPANTPASVNDLLEGRDWREHRIGPSPSTPVFESRAQRYHLPLELPLNDGLSVHSGSDRTSFSQSRSISQLHGTAAGSPLSPHFRGISSSLQRKPSVSSVSSRSNSFLSSSRLGVSSNSRLSYSSTNLSLHVAKTLPSTTGLDDSADLEGIEDEADQLSELNEIQQRRNEVITRYTQRIEYLKAKQKGAELHERLVRK